MEKLFQGEKKKVASATVWCAITNFSKLPENARSLSCDIHRAAYNIVCASNKVSLNCM